MASPSSAAAAPMSREEAASWHGYLAADAGFPAPTCTTSSDTLSRPNYTQVRSTEYLDSPEVLQAKAAMLIRMWSAATHPVVYAGAGISTSSGIRDYASNASGSKVQPQQRKLTMSFIGSLKPTPAHRVLTAMEKRGMVWGWLQQNHDGLAQKAGFPARKVNELHGAWLDQKSNPIIKMSGSLRGDLYEWLLAMEKGTDFVFAVGTSLSGLNADRLVETTARRHKRGEGHGVCILSIQKTQRDADAALRVFSKIDDFMLIVAQQLGIVGLPTAAFPYAAPPLPVGPPKESEWLAERKSRMEAAAAAAASPAPPAAAGVPAAKPPVPARSRSVRTKPAPALPAKVAPAPPKPARRSPSGSMRHA